MPKSTFRNLPTSNLQSTLNASPKTSEQLRQLQAQLAALKTEKKHREENRLLYYFQNIEEYPKHREFFRVGREHRERLFMSAHRVGKTYAGAGEMAFHLTGMYPVWWEGKVFHRQVRAIAASKTAMMTRNIIQAVLFGPYTAIGTGLLPKRVIVRTTPKHGVAEAFDTAYVAHISGGVSRLSLKSYDQGLSAFFGTEEDVIFLDEEGPEVSSDGSFMDIYTQCCIRTMTTDGIVYVTLTPLQGRTRFIEEALQNCVNRNELPYR